MKIVRRVLIVVVVLVVVLASAAAGRFYVLAPTVRPAQDLHAPTTAAAIEHGRYLVHHVAACIGCHSKVDSSQPGEPLVAGHWGEGRDFGDMPGFPGHVRAPNLTPDPETGLGAWTDGEIVRAIREGVSRDGRPLFPMMPYATYARTLSDADTLDVVAYLRSLPPIRNAVPKTAVDFPASMFMRAVPRPVAHALPAAPSEADPPARGRWLLDLCSCGECHDTIDDRHEPLPGMHLAGGQKFAVGGKGFVYSSNITPDPTTGAGAFSEAELRRALDEGVGHDGRPLYGMPWFYYRGMTDADKRALLLALRQVPAVLHVVPAAELKR